MAKLYFKYGAMNSGKSTILLQSAHNYEERGMRTVIIKPVIDTKGADSVVSRLGVSRKVHHLVSANDNIRSIIEKDIAENGNLHCIFVDECQFLSVPQADELFWIAVDMDIPVICYGLRTDFLTNGFAASSRSLKVPSPGMASSIRRVLSRTQAPIFPPLSAARRSISALPAAGSNRAWAWYATQWSIRYFSMYS